MDFEHPPLQDILSKVIKLQNKLNEIVPGKGEEIYKSLNLGNVTLTYNKIADYAKEYVYLLKIRPYCLDDIVNLCIWTALTPGFGEKFVLALFDQLIFQESYYLLRKLVQFGLISLEAVISAIKDNEYYDVSLYFADMINIDDYIKNDYEYISPKYMKHYELIQKLKKQEGFDFTEFYEYLWQKDELPLLLKKDDLNSFVTAINSLTQIGIQIDWSPFEIYPKPKQTTLICLAALFGAYNCFKHILSKGSVITDSVAEAAVIGGNKNILNHILKTKFDVKQIVVTIHNYSRTDLMELISKYVMPPFKLLYRFRNYSSILHSLGDGIAINSAINRDLVTPVHMVAEAGDFDKLILFTEASGDLKAITRSKNTVVLQAAQSGNVQSLDFLLQKNNKHFDTNLMGHTIAHCASESGSIKMVKYVESVFPSFYSGLDKSGWNAFLHAVNSGSIQLVKYMLLDKGQDINFKTNNAVDAVYIAFTNQNIELVKWLLDHGFQLNDEERDELLSKSKTREMRALFSTN